MQPDYPGTKHHSLLIPLIITVLLLAAAAVFGVWAFNSRQDYKNNSDQKAVAAVKIAQQQTMTADAKQYAAAAELPLRAYQSPEADGSIIVHYPKTWSAYVIDSGNNGSMPVNGYFQPSVVPSVQDQTVSFALRLQVSQTSYDQVLSQFQGLVKQQKVTIAPFSFAKVPSVIGVRIDGQIEQNKQGSMIVMPLRATTLQLWTESTQYETDFNNNILPNFSFSP